MKKFFGRSILDSSETYLMVAFSALFLLTRLLFLDERTLHHDESLYAVEAWRYATKGEYQFSPILHGPLLFHLHALLFKIFPATDFTARLPSAISGLAVSFFGYALFRKFSKKVAYLFLSLILISPILTYFSRFLGMDALLSALTMALLFFGYRFLEKPSKPLFFLLSGLLTAMICTKLNFLFILFVLGSFPIAAFLLNKKAFLKIQEKAGSAFLSLSRWDYLIALAIFVGLFILLYSSLGSNWGGVLDGLYREMIPYWVGQHKARRVEGPMDYYWGALIIYELPWVLLLIGVFLKRLAASKDARFNISVFGGGCVFGFAVTLLWSFLHGFFTRALHIDNLRHLWIFSFQAIAWLVLIRAAFRAKRYAQAFFVHWFFVSIFLYGYAGEKVPWLAFHVALPLLGLCSFYLEDVLGRGRFFKGLLMAGLGAVFFWQSVVMVRANFILFNSPREILVYTHTSEDVHEVVRDVRSQLENGHEGTLVKVKGDAGWPLYWYFRNMPGWYALEIDWADLPYFVIMDWVHRKPPPFPSLYHLERKKLREWWTPDMRKLTIRKGLRYYLFRETFSPLGSQDLAFYFLNSD